MLNQVGKCLIICVLFIMNLFQVVYAVPTIIDKKILIISSGLAGTGKSTHLKALKEKLINTVHIDKDTINEALMPKEVNFNQFNAGIRDQLYSTMLKLADLNLEQNRIVILEGYFGNKLTSNLLKNYINSNKFETKIIYFHCSGAKQKERLLDRANKDKMAAARDVDKLAEGKFERYRLEHILSHLENLSQVSHLIIDTENDDDLDKNVEKIIAYLELPRQANAKFIKKQFSHLSAKDAMQGAQTFQQIMTVGVP